MSHQLMSDIANSNVKLNKAEVNDKSGPVIDEGVQVKKIDRGAHLGAIVEGVDLNKAEVNDKSGPKLPSAVKVQDRNALISEVANANVQLNKAEVNDKSGPVIEEGVQVKKVIDEGVQVKKIDRN
eukprot:TRINITY_DN210_c0_g1_i4.p1 TRINITY_DN210_c0_g1~~TRINITY_DN210_c0_g1_i4.p1  ORF type:complete len:125 (-),score=42.27 TRINITY_DN210_c0_g1_i4:145-519(-)